MPVVRISYPRGALGVDHKQALASLITDIVLEAEVGVATDAGRAVTLVRFDEVRDEDWAVGGVLRALASEPPTHFVVQVLALQGLLDDAGKRNIHTRITRALEQVLGPMADPKLPLRTWIYVQEVPEGAWGAAGTTVSAADVARLMNPAIRR